jgi:hypothetical protein
VFAGQIVAKMIASVYHEEFQYSDQKIIMPSIFFLTHSLPNHFPTLLSHPFANVFFVLFVLLCFPKISHIPNIHTFQNYPNRLILIFIQHIPLDGIQKSWFQLSISQILNQRNKNIKLFPSLYGSHITWRKREWLKRGHCLCLGERGSMFVGDDSGRSICYKYRKPKYDNARNTTDDDDIALWNVPPEFIIFSQY